ncbi:MAG: zinc-regulated TonB-dependent outer membrane receptor [Myxococcales bacterium]|nr:zinc-regulated TonB-dependent outer membrane receptor [Myxococcales bacterium]MCB9531837.1 zinc-regulated TonB-dependent outer membrane receptor [Myxococcales bacterium]
MSSLGANVSRAALCCLVVGAVAMVGAGAARAQSTSDPAAANPAMSLILDTALAYFSEREPDQLGGHDPNHTGFTLQQLEMHLEAAVDPFFTAQANIVFSQFGVEVEEAYATTTALPGRLQLRVGQFLTRFGRMNPTHPHARAFVDQAIAPGKLFGSEGSRGLGTEVSWLLPLPWFVEAVASVTDARGECCARSFLGSEDVPIRGLEDFLYTVALKQSVDASAATTVMFGGSGQFGPNGTGNGNRSAIVGADLYLRVRPPDSPNRRAFSLALEGFGRARQVPGASLRDHGFVAQSVVTFSPRWDLGLRWECMSGVKDDPADPEWVENRRRGTVAATYYPSHFSRVRLQLESDLDENKPRPGYAGMLATEFLIGAHGAHSF